MTTHHWDAIVATGLPRWPRSLMGWKSEWYPGYKAASR
jgi:hypothetical protein